ncbi:alpha/beta fold hydrolase [Paraglaciecola sp.]|uniref:alpha/beta fold hydrolase n=1 Tax=Paraglaciecola sp. TaxID=1920173 RepID=UPI00273F357F|nr:alpha/beta hydrolase [Paraglaciecola sp.]MDP5029958.1 alpha/beta hydrolase [Paraglaciecola sp.]
MVLPELLAYMDERQRLGKRWVETMIETSIPLYFINGAQDSISGRQLLDRYIDIVPNARTALLDVGHYPQLEAPQAVLHLY